MNVNKQNIALKLGEFACFFFGIGCFFSIALKNICVGVCLFCIFVLIFYNKILRHVFAQNLKKNPYSWICLIFGLMAFIGVFYSCANFERALSIFCKYSRLVFLPILLVPFFYKFTHLSKRCFQGLLTGLILFSITRYITLQNHINFRPINPIYTSILFSSLSVYFFVSALEQKWGKKICYFTYWLLGVVYLFTLNYQKTGIFIILIIHFLFAAILSLKLIRSKKIFFLHWAVFILICIAYNYGPQKSRFTGFNKQVLGLLTKTEKTVLPVKTIPIKPEVIVVSLKDRIKGHFISLFYKLCWERTEFLKTGWAFFKEKPWFGYGTGSWATLVVERKIPYIHNKMPDLKYNIPNPHNEWVNVSVQWGVLGAFVIFFWLFIPWFFSQLKGFYFLDKTLLLLWPIMLLLAGFSDIVLFISTTRDFYIVTLAAIFANACRRKQIYHASKNYIEASSKITSQKL